VCGIAGILTGSNPADVRKSLHAIDAMTDSLARRGPDDRGIWTSSKDGVAFGHRRLSVVDLSESGHQPMASASGRYILTFNGEIYNYVDLRSRLDRMNIRWKSHTDSEVLVEAIDHWGLERTISRLDGMFAFAIWDRQQKVLTLVRDRIGEKPLVFARCDDGSVIFASELRALERFPPFSLDFDNEALTLYMRHGYIPAPFTVYARARKVMAGSIVRFSEASREPTTSHYWDPYAQYHLAKANANKHQPDFLAATEQFKELITNSVRLRMRADVPVGAFLSGGLDSSLIAALMQRESNHKVQTFTIGFDEAKYDESDDARNVARYLGTTHTEFIVNGNDALREVESITEIYDEPFADSSQIPTSIVSRLARQSVTVSLSGDGGDELFAGYLHYKWLRALWRAVGWMPEAVREGLLGPLGSIEQEKFSAVQRYLRPVLPARLSDIYGANRLRRLLHIAAAKTVGDAHRRLVSDCTDPETYLTHGKDPGDAFSTARQFRFQADVISRLSFLDTIQYLPDDLLVKLDRASMYHSLESRIPLLDHKIVEFAFGLPTAFKFSNGLGKRILREILYQYIPQDLLDRPKQGFQIPVAKWLRGPLKTWASDLLSPEKIRKEGVFDAQIVSKTWTQHLSGNFNWEHRLWSILMFQSWNIRRGNLRYSRALD